MHAIWRHIIVTSILLLSLSLAYGQRVMSAEYYWDTDPGQGSGTSLPATDGNFDGIVEGIIGNGIGLPVDTGAHSFNIRVQDSTGTWGPTFSIVIDVRLGSSSIRDISVSQGEYFWNTDPGQGNGTPLIAFDGAFDEALEQLVQNAPLPGPTGVYALSTRVKDVAGNWGPKFTVVISVDSTISSIRDIKVTQAEYFWGTDPGQGSGTPLIAFDGSFDEALESVVQNAPLPATTGVHKLSMRGKDVAGNWGPVFSVIIAIDSAISTIRNIKVTAAEYFFNNDPGPGNATPMVAQDGNFNQALESILGASIPIPVNAGVNRLSIRARDVAGNWGPLFSVVVNVDTTIFPCDSLNSAFTSSSAFGYAGYTVDLTNTSHNGQTFEWLVNGISFSTDTNTTFTFDSAGVYTIQLVALNTGCYDTATLVIPVGKAQFQKTYGNGNNDIEAVSVVTKDGGYFMAQQNNYSGASSLAMVITKLNVFGNLQWTKTLDSVQIDKPTAVLEASDGSFYVTGYSALASGGVDAFLIKMNANGTLTWQRRLNSGGNEYAYALVEASNGDIVVTGRVSDNGGTTFGEYDVFLTRINNLGSIVWARVYGGPANDQGYAVDATSDGGFIIGGLNQPTGVSLNYPYFVKTNSFGVISWTLTIPGSSNNDAITDIIQTSDGGYLATGLTYSFGPGSGDAALFKLTSGGAVSWTKAYGTTAGMEFGRNVVETNDGYAVGGTSATGGFGGNDQLLFKTNTAGTLVWAKNYGSTGEDAGFAVDVALDEGFALSGHTNSFNSSYEAYLVRTDSLGASGCQEQNVTLITGSSTPFTGTLTAEKTLALLSSTVSYAVLSNPLTVAEPCSPGSCNDVFTTIDTTVCFGQTVLGHASSGVFVDTYPLGTACDSIRTLTLTVLPQNNTTVTTSICEGNSYYGHNTSGQFVDVFTDANGCDSTRTLNLTVKDTAVTIVTTSICFGTSYYGHTTSGQYVDVFTGANSCDSTRVLNLTVRTQNNTTVNASICAGQNYYGHTTNGTFIDNFTDRFGCDSTRTLNLTVNSNITTTVNASVCYGGSYQGYTTTGQYIDQYTATGGCDSIRTLNLTVRAENATTITTSICEGNSYYGHNVTGTYTDNFTDRFGCDSTRTLNLTVNDTAVTTLTVSVCFGGNYQGYTTSGQYIDVYSSANNCDSTRVLNLTVRAQNTRNITVGICTGQSYYGHTTNGTYTDHFTDRFGCDSTRVLNLTVSNYSQTTVDTSVCFGGSVLGHNTTGTYRDTFSTSSCDSIRILNLTVYPQIPVTVIDSTVCFGVTVFGYNASGNYTDNYTNTNGCDSSRTLNLTVLPQASSTFTETICDGESFEGYTATGTYRDTFALTNGCDSVRTINLTVEPSVSTTSTLALCAGDSVLLGGVYVSTAGTYTDTIATAGCDTVVTVMVTVYPATNAPNIIRNGNILAVSTGLAGYQWYQDGNVVAGGNTATLAIISNGNYNVVVTDANGCTVSSNVLNVTNVGIGDIDWSQAVDIYPNPVEDELTISITGIEKADVLVYNSLGQLIYTGAVVDAKPSIVNMTYWAAGVYHIKLVSGAQVYATKVVRAR